MQQELGPVDLEEWVSENAERVQRHRDQAVVNMRACSEARKEIWDKRVKIREFEKGDLVYMRKSGINTKLSESWVGPHTVVRNNSVLSYRIDTGDRMLLPSVHIQLLKEYTPREPESSIRRVTTVLEPDTESDSMEHQCTEVTLSGIAEADDRERDVNQWETDFSDILTKEPGLTNLAEFKIDTGPFVRVLTTLLTV